LNVGSVSESQAEGGNEIAGLRVMLLGGFDARLASGAPLHLPTKKAQALLAYLGLRPGQSHPRHKLAALLWGEKSDDQARGGLRHALVALRRALADAIPPALLIDGQTLALNPVGVEVDVATFEHRVAEGTPQALEDAAELYRGDLLLGFTVNEPLFEEWLVAQRERLREMALGALAQLLAHQTKTAATERAIQTAVRLLGLDPLQEAVHRTLMRLYARQGRRGAALKQYQVCVGVLQRELGTAPEAETKTLYQALLRRQAEVVKASDAQGNDRSRPAQTVGLAPPDLPAAETPLFGRQAELGRLRQRLDEAIRGNGHIATVAGEAGIGKTRLASGLAADALARGCRVLIGYSHESDSILPFGPWVDACRNGQISTDEEILGALHPTRRAELARLLPEAGIAGLPPASDSALLLFESVAQLIEQVAARQPLVLVLEDLHWADEMSLRLLAFVSRRIPAWPALLITTAREEELTEAAIARRTLEELSRASQAMPVVLSPLSRHDTALLVRALTRVGSAAPTLAHVEEQIWAMSEGNPLVAVEAMRALDQDSLWEGARENPGALALPARIRELVARRLDRLSGRSQQMAAVAAVVGRRFDFPLLQAASGVNEREAAQAVEEMVRHRVLQAVGNQLDFAHDRIRDVAYGRLLPLRRRLLHRAVAEALEGMGAGTVDPMKTPPRDLVGEQIEQLAHHALRGELRERAVHYLRQAGNKAVARSALLDARAWFEQALGTLATLPESQATLEEAFEIRLALRSVLSQLGEFRRVRALLREAEALAERLNDDGRRGRVCAFMTNVHSRLDEPDEALVSGMRALEIAGRLGDLKLRILATTYLEQAHYYRGEYARVVELATDNLAALPRDWVHEFFGSNQPPSVNDRVRLLLSLAHLGRFAEASEYEAEAIQLAEPTQHAYTVGLVYHAASTLYLVKGDWAKAHALIERQIAVLRTGNIVGELPMALASSARALAYLGDAGEALNRLRESEQLLEDQSARERIGNGWIYYSLGHACWLLGRLDEARRLADRAVESPSGRTDFVPNARHLLGDIATHADRFDAESGEAHYREARALAEPRGMRPLVAHCHLGLGTLYARAGKPQEAREHFVTATTMYRAMDMDFWLEKAHAETRRLGSCNVRARPAGAAPSPGARVGSRPSSLTNAPPLAITCRDHVCES
jgi:DNA-binding SARP family transcriptional activator/tetratricopeptide (TPR) repeat protein